MSDTTSTGYRCAVVVFVDVPFGVDQDDAESIAEAAVRRGLRQVTTSSSDLPIQTDRGWEYAHVRLVRELGVACRNGYLWTSPSSRAWH